MRFQTLRTLTKNCGGALLPNKRTRLGLSIALALAFLAIFLSHIAGMQAEARTAAPPMPVLETTSRQAMNGTASYPNCRFGTLEHSSSIVSYDIAPLNLGWYGNWGTSLNPPRPGGMAYMQLISVSDGAAFGSREHPGPLSYSPSGSTLEAIIAANPGSLWLVGNEPDCMWQNNVLPQNYAQIYHDIYTFIKTRDATARVAAGGIVQPTPLRMQYLDLVLASYQDQFGTQMPMDIWHIHSFILREVDCRVYTGSCYGCEIPPGVDATHGMLYTLDHSDRQDIFQDRLAQFRQWMADRGYRDTPLIVTEYGTLLPYYDPESLYYDSQGNPFDGARASDFMVATFDYMLAASDPEIGYPADENHLVQQWFWYSLDDTINYGGALFEPNTKARMQLGTDLATYTSAISPVVDILAVAVEQVGPPPLSPTSTATLTLRARVSNIGNISATQPIAVRFLDGMGYPIGSDQVISAGLAGCAGLAEVTVTWTDLAPGAYIVRAVVDPTNEIEESNEDNNEAIGVVLVATNRLILPLVMRAGE